MLKGWLRDCMTPERDKLALDFLKQCGWQSAEREFLSGDASFRSYERLKRGTESAVLMDAPPEQEPLSSFILVDEYLVNQGYKAPKIYGRDVQNGFLLLEDLGNDLFSHWLKSAPAQECELYIEAANLLVDMHQRHHPETETHPLKNKIPDYTVDLLLQEVSLFIDWYLTAHKGEAYAQKYRTSFLATWKKLLEQAPWLPEVIVLRDFHADNLIWLPHETRLHKVGLLDFQDAVLGSPAYDVVSFLEDARRDVQPETLMTTLNHYLQQMQWDADSFMTCYALLGAQRNMKIIGIFTRLAMRDNKPAYLDLLPRVWGHLHHDLHHSILRPLENFLDNILPEPHDRGIPSLFATPSAAPAQGASHG